MNTIFYLSEPVKPTVLGPIRCANEHLEMNDAVEFHVEYDAVPQPEVVWTRNNCPLDVSENVQANLSSAILNYPIAVETLMLEKEHLF